MANATATISISSYPTGVDNTARREIICGTIKLAQGAYPAGGFPLSWANLEQLKAIPLGGSSPASTGNLIPINMDVNSTSFPPSGIIWVWDSVNGNLHAMISADASSNNSGPLVEFGGASLPGWMLNDIITFKAEFNRN